MQPKTAVVWMVSIIVVNWISEESAAVFRIINFSTVYASHYFLNKCSAPLNVPNKVGIGLGTSKGKENIF